MQTSALGMTLTSPKSNSGLATLSLYPSLRVETELTLAAAKPARPQLTEEERAAKAAEKKAAKEAKKANKKENPAPPQAKKEEDLSVTRLNIRVGKIVKAENHPDADALYVEQIDIGVRLSPRLMLHQPFHSSTKTPTKTHNSIDCEHAHDG